MSPDAQAASADGLPEYFLNAKQVLEQGMPKLFIGEPGTQTVSSQGSIKVYFHGELGKWTSFTDDVLGFWKQESTVHAFERCAHLPVGPDPKIKELNPNAMIDESIQCGGEITVSGRFYSNALAPVIHCVRTLGAGQENGLSNVTFGDAWIRDDRILDQYPDVIGKVFVEKDFVTRLVGEIKFPNTVNIALMVADAVKGKSTGSFRAILGQIVNYMLSHRLKYAFLTNYKATTCLRLGHINTGNGLIKPRILFSSPIDAGEVADDKNISVRLALFYLIHKVSSPKEDDWQISEDMKKVTERTTWLSTKPAPDRPLNTPDGHRLQLPGQRVNRDLPAGRGEAGVPHLHTDLFTGQRVLDTPTKLTKEQLSQGHSNYSQDIGDTPAFDPRRLLKTVFRGETQVSEEDGSSVELEIATEGVQCLSLSDPDSRPDSSSSG